MTTFGNFVEHCLSHPEKVEGDLWYCSQQHYPELAVDHPVPDIMLHAKLLTTPYAWIGQVGSGPGLHIDMADNVLCQIRGDKKVWLFPPEDTHFCYPRLGGQTNFSDIPDVTDQATIESKFPLFKKARRFEAILKPGDCLFLPAKCVLFLF
jgi:[protein]-arginine 3-hydroxylase / protease